MNDFIVNQISSVLKTKVQNVSVLTGGDISKAYKLDAQNQSFFLKLNTGDEAYQMFQTEARGLDLIRSTNTIATPEVISVDQSDGYSYLLMQFIHTKRPDASDFGKLGESLAHMHRSTSQDFGLSYDNFIGSLPQSNGYEKDWPTFYYKQRLAPQMQLAIQNDMLDITEIPSEESIQGRLYELMMGMKPTLLHGDLWSGNYLISVEGKPYLIDPAVYYGHSEVDIAMSRLFGGFSEAFYTSYFNEIPNDKHTQDRIKAYQLYYLLVHLNLFGRSYKSSVTHILKSLF